MKKYDYSLISSELPNGRLTFAMADPEEKDASMMTTCDRSGLWVGFGLKRPACAGWC